MSHISLILEGTRGTRHRTLNTGEILRICQCRFIQQKIHVCTQLAQHFPTQYTHLHPAPETRPAVHSSRGSLVRLGSLERLDQRRVPDVHHLGVASVIGMDAVAIVGRAAEACILVDNPDGRLGLVLALGPGGDRGVERLDLGVGARHGGAKRNDLSHL